MTLNLTRGHPGTAAPSVPFTSLRRHDRDHSAGTAGTPTPRHRGGSRPNRRRILLDLVEEYARHAGHADLIRESVDGLTAEDPPR
ncbi:DUF664 domain-containing protein [Streptomyces sp. NPDC060020]|uniref:mycothiol transferase n=1 Tax=Streptomyces sp. NPDC060020 TaxID=3347038 RepID=UPI0036AA94A9